MSPGATGNRDCATAATTKNKARAALRRKEERLILAAIRNLLGKPIPRWLSLCGEGSWMGSYHGRARLTLSKPGTYNRFEPHTIGAEPRCSLFTTRSPRKWKNSYRWNLGACACIYAG